MVFEWLPRFNQPHKPAIPNNPQGDGSHKIVWQNEPKFNTQLSEFNSLTKDEVKKIILMSPNKYCVLVPIPTDVFRELIDEILPLLTQIINLSLQLGNMPTSLKKAIIKPMLKKLGLELINKNYRHVSNMAFLSKLIERVVALQLVVNLLNNGLMDIFQSVYREGTAQKHLFSEFRMIY